MAIASVLSGHVTEAIAGYRQNGSTYHGSQGHLKIPVLVNPNSISNPVKAGRQQAEASLVGPLVARTYEPDQVGPVVSTEFCTYTVETTVLHSVLPSGKSDTASPIAFVHYDFAGQSKPDDLFRQYVALR